MSKAGFEVELKQWRDVRSTHRLMASLYLAFTLSYPLA